jgi:hypothetical protein
MNSDFAKVDKHLRRRPTTEKIAHTEIKACIADLRERHMRILGSHVEDARIVRADIGCI